MSGRTVAPIIVILLALSLAGIGGQGTAAARGAPLYYVAVGDSLSVGVQPDGAGHGPPTSEGYADQLYALLRARTPNLQLVKLGCEAAETTTTLRDGGGRCSYPGGSQLAAAVAFLEANRGAIAYVTVSVGANDALKCEADGTIDVTCASTVLVAAPRNVEAIVAALRAAAGPSVPIVGMTLYNPLLRGWLDGPAGEARARETAPLVALYNSALADAYARGGAAVGDVAGAFANDDFESMVDVAGFGRLPLNVARLCQWTWECAPPPFGPDIHANAAGYSVIAGVFAATLDAAPSVVSTIGPIAASRPKGGE